jgi:ubiquinone biosynthesis protein
MRLTSLTHYQRDGKRLAQIISVLVRYGLAERLVKVEPEFVKRWLKHEGLGELAKLPLGHRIRLACEELGPTFIKIGQILSTRPDVVPKSVALALEELQANTPASPTSDVSAIVEEQLGGPITEKFAYFDETPLASASIGQVHGARMHDGTPVVVKVQHPGIEDRVHVDLNILIHLARFFEEHDPELRAYSPLALAEEAKRTLLRELDFRRELRNQQAFERNFEDTPEVVIPETYPELSARRVLTMQHLDGFSIREIDRVVAHGHDPARLALIGAHAFLKMVFQDRMFHADPHPGNVFVLPDGRLGLLDFGMVGRLDEDLLDDLLDLLVGFVQKDTGAIARAVHHLGSVPLDCDQAMLKRDLAELQVEMSDIPMGDLDATLLLDQFTALVRNHRIRLPATISMLIKVLVMLDGTSRRLDRNFSLTELLHPYCKEAIRRRLSPRTQARRALETGKDWSRFLVRLPRVLDNFTQRIQQQALSVDLEHKGLEATVDRLVSGVLCSAMLLGGSIMWALSAPPTLFGVSVLGFVATALALLHGVRLLIKLGPH